MFCSQVDTNLAPIPYTTTQECFLKTKQNLFKPQNDYFLEYPLFRTSTTYNVQPHH